MLITEKMLSTTEVGYKSQGAPAVEPYMWFANALSDEVGSSEEPQGHPASSEETSDDDFEEEKVEDFFRPNFA